MPPLFPIYPPSLTATSLPGLMAPHSNSSQKMKVYTFKSTEYLQTISFIILFIKTINMKTDTMGGKSKTPYPICNKFCFKNTTVSYFAFAKYTYQFIRNIKQIPLAFAQLADLRYRAHLKCIVYFSEKLQNPSWRLK